MGEKFKPVAKIVERRDEEGWRTWEEIAYYCPKCGKRLHGYASTIGCADCEIFFDWGNAEPKIQRITKIIGW